MKFIKQLTWKQVFTFIFFFFFAYVVVEAIETLIEHFFGVNPKATGVGILVLVIMYGFKFHIFCCLFPGLYATYRIKHKKCTHEHCGE